MKQFILTRKKAITGFFAMLLISIISMSFLDLPLGYSELTGEDEFTYEGCSTDTLPEKEGITMKDFDKLQSELDKTLGKVGAELKGIDFEKLQKNAAELELKEIDMDKIMKSVELSLKSIDLEKTMAEVSSSLKDLKIDYKKEEVEKALAEATKEIDKAKLEIKEIDKETIKKELANAKKEIEKSKLEIEKIDMNKIMDEAREGVDKAKEELKLTKEMFTEMEKDGLINSKAGFTIEYKNKEFYIDGKKQDEKTTDKYRKYFKEDHFKIIINKE
jgi:chromosome segregation ATPase